MLSLNRSLYLSQKSKGIIKSLMLKQGGVLTKDSWSKVTKSVKNEISKKLFNIQGFRCAYCERYLTGLGPQIDHFAPVNHHPQFTFIPSNLFYSCYSCNSSKRKGQKNTVGVIKIYYKKCTFKIIHPLYHNFSAEISFSDKDNIFYDLASCTQLGIDTINFFGWDDLEYTNIRSITLIYERMNPLASQIELDLIQEAIAYK